MDTSANALEHAARLHRNAAIRPANIISDAPASRVYLRSARLVVVGDRFLIARFVERLTTMDLEGCRFVYAVGGGSSLEKFYTRSVKMQLYERLFFPFQLIRT